MDKNVLKRNYITEKELTEIFQDQYNDIFPDILNYDYQNFVDTLKKQVMTYLEITKKFTPQMLFKKVENNFIKKYLDEKDIISKDYEIIKNSRKDQIEYLDKLNCIIHCPKSKEALHTCGYKFVLYGDYVYCLFCSKVYNEHQVWMYCDECDIDYYTKLREILDYDFENYLLVSINDYHCKLDQEEKIKCPQCFADLYADIYNIKNYDQIEELFCVYCNMPFDVNLFNFKCKKCGTIFKNKAKIYNEFNYQKNELICKVHTLSEKKFALPESFLNRNCECNLNDIKKYRHNDGGILYEGEKNGERIIVCDKCYQIFDYYNFIFSCPLCNKKFKPSYIDYQKMNYGFENYDYNKGLQYDTNVEKNKNQRNNIGLIKEQHYNSNKEEGNKDDAYYKDQGQFSSSNKNKKTKNIIINNPFSTRNKLLRSSNNKNMSNSKKVSKTYRENDKDFNSNKKFNQTLKDQNINIKIQNFYNNYAPIIHIIEKNPKNSEKNNDSKYLINRNYTLIHNSPKIKKKLKPNMEDPSKYAANPSILKRSITENSKYNIGARNSNENYKKNIKNDNQENEKENIKEKEPNINYSNNIWNHNKKKLSASFTVTTTNNTNSINFTDCIINNNGSKNAKSQKKGKKRCHDAEHQTKIKKANSVYTKFNMTKLDVKRKPISKVNTINECKEEYNNDTKDTNIKKSKILLKIEHNDKNDKNNGVKKYNKKKFAKVQISSSLSEEKYKKLQFQKGQKKTEYGEKIKKVKSNNKNNNHNIKVNDNNPINKENNISSVANKANNISKIQKPKAIQKSKTIKNEFKAKRKILKDFNSENYNILNIIGEGTFSQIFLVENGKTHERFALKKMAATKIEDLEEKKKEFELIQQLTKEDEKLNLVKVYGIQIKQLDKFNMVLYILMEAAVSDWETELKNRHYSKQFYTEEELKNILTNLVQTFSSLQKKGICHRDVKPQNILCFKNGSFKITDFGEAKANTNGGAEKNTKFNFSKDTSIQTIRGTELYMSPILFSALRNSSVDDLQYNAFKSDVFSLGLCFLLAACLTYKPLSELREIRENNEIKSLIEKHLKGKYSKNFLEVLQIMLQLEEKDRPDFIELESIIKMKL